MAIVQTITDPYHFGTWLKQSDNYKNNFSLEGAKIVQEYMDEYGEGLNSPQEFDPIAWCCEFSEYKDVHEAYKEHYGDASDLPEAEQKLEYFEDNTQVLSESPFIIAAF